MSANPATVVEFVEFVKTATLAGLLAAVLFGGYFQVWVWGHQLRSALAERDMWRDRFLSRLELLEKAAADRLRTQNDPLIEPDDRDRTRTRGGR